MDLQIPHLPLREKVRGITYLKISNLYKKSQRVSMIKIETL
jgi:hypothetical protein